MFLRSSRKAAAILPRPIIQWLVRLGMGTAATLGSSVLAQNAVTPACSSLTEARGQIAQQEWNKAEQTLRPLIAENARCADARYLLGYVLLRANKPDASLKEYTGAAQLRPPTSDEFLGVASDYILLKDYSDAEHWLQRAVRTTPVNPQAWYLLGRTQYNLERNAAAAESFKRSLSMLPEDPRSEYNLGLVYERLQQPDLARTAYQTAIQWEQARHIQDAQPYLDLGILTRSQGHADEALPLLQQAAEISKDNPTIFLELGRTFVELKRPDEAIVALKRAATLAPSAEPPHYFLGRAYRAAGKVSLADEQFAIVQQLAGSHSSSTTPNADSHGAEPPR